MAAMLTATTFMGCAHQRIDPRSCPYTGSDWKLERRPPANAAELLGLLDAQHPGLSSPRDNDAYWFENSTRQVLYCEVSKCNGWSFRFTPGDTWSGQLESDMYVVADCRR